MSQLGIPKYKIKYSKSYEKTKPEKREMEGISNGEERKRKWGIGGKTLNHKSNQRSYLNRIVCLKAYFQRSIIRWGSQTTVRRLVIRDERDGKKKKKNGTYQM